VCKPSFRWRCEYWNEVPCFHSTHTSENPSDFMAMQCTAQLVLLHAHPISLALMGVFPGLLLTLALLSSGILSKYIHGCLKLVLDASRVWLSDGMSLQLSGPSTHSPGALMSIFPRGNHSCDVCHFCAEMLLLASDWPRYHHRRAPP
jgi:hypothetical protein